MKYHFNKKARESNGQNTFPHTIYKRVDKYSFTYLLKQSVVIFIEWKMNNIQLVSYISRYL